MGALSDLLQISAGGVATPATPATQPSAAVRVSQVSQVSQGCEPEIRARLLRLAESEGVDAAHVHRMHADDVTACAGQSDPTLKAYLRALVLGAGMDAGQVPPGWTTAAHCEGCGPVWLWPDAARVRACPWCFRRKAGKRIPRPPVQCGYCDQYVPDPLNPEAGMGGCRLGDGRARWPMQAHRCPDMRPPNADKPAPSLMISHSVESTP